LALRLPLGKESLTRLENLLIRFDIRTAAGTQTVNHQDSVDFNIDSNGHASNPNEETDDENEDPGYPWDPPSGLFSKIWWLCFLPTNFLFFLTIPDVRRGGKCVKLYPLSFFMCMAWIGAISYELTWLITVIGYTIQVPDTVMGLTFLAIGTSIPEVFSSLIVSKQVRFLIFNRFYTPWSFNTLG